MNENNPFADHKTDSKTTFVAEKFKFLQAGDTVRGTVTNFGSYQDKFDSEKTIPTIMVDDAKRGLLFIQATQIGLVTGIANSEAEIGDEIEIVYMGEAKTAKGYMAKLFEVTKVASAAPAAGLPTQF